MTTIEYATSEGEWYAASLTTPFFCFVGKTKEEVDAKVNAALESYQAYVRRRPEDAVTAPTQRTIITTVRPAYREERRLAIA